MGLRARRRGPLPGGFLGRRKFGSIPPRAASPAPCRRWTGIRCCLLPVFHLMGLMGCGMRLQCPRAAFPLHSAGHPLLPPARVPTTAAQENLCSPRRRRKGKKQCKSIPPPSRGTGQMRVLQSGTHLEPRGNAPQSGQHPYPVGQSRDSSVPAAPNTCSPSLSDFIFSSVLQTQLCR